MKKLITLITVLSLALAASFSVSAATVESVTDANTASADVNVVFVADDGTTVLTPATVYNVTVKFADLEVEWKVNSITGAAGMVWDPSTHTYNVTDTDGDNVTYTAPDAITNAVTVANHSNAAVAVSARFDEDKVAEANGATATLSEDDDTLASAAASAYGEYNNAASTAYDITFGGTPVDPTQGFTLGTITVTISESAAN